MSLLSCLECNVKIKQKKNETKKHWTVKLYQTVTVAHHDDTNKTATLRLLFFFSGSQFTKLYIVQHKATITIKRTPPVCDTSLLTLRQAPNFLYSAYEREGIHHSLTSSLRISLGCPQVHKWEALGENRTSQYQLSIKLSCSSLRQRTPEYTFFYWKIVIWNSKTYNY